MLIDGQDTTLLDAADRGLQYGDGLFETIAVLNGRLQLWARHMARLEEGCRRLGIPMPEESLLRGEAEHLAQGQVRAVLKLMLTRGSGGRGYRPPAAPQPRRILSLHPWPEYPATWSEEGVTVRLCQTPLACNPSLAGIKHLNRLEQVLARAEWDDAAIAEGLMLDAEHHLVEGTMSNLFLVRDGWLLTPRVDRCGVAGVMRAHLQALAAQLNVGCDETLLRLADLERAEEAFLCNSVIGIWPLRRFQEWEFPLGALTRRLQEALPESLES